MTTHLDPPHPEVLVIPDSVTPLGVTAVVLEEDTFLVLSAPPEVRRIEQSLAGVLEEARDTPAQAPGSVVVRSGRPLRLLAVVHDLSREPSWREEWIAGALEAVLAECGRRRIRALAVPLLGRVHGRTSVEGSVALLAAALHAHAPATLERVWVVVREDDAATAREAAARMLR